MMRRTFSPAGWPAMGERGGLVEVDQGKGLAMVGRDDPWSACIHMRTQQRPDPLVRLLFRRLITFCFPATFQWESVRCKKHLLFRGKLSTGRGLPVLLSVINGPSLSPPILTIFLPTLSFPPFSTHRRPKNDSGG